MTTPTSPGFRYTGLDGLRALAVVLVLLYHLFPDSPLRSGFIGVDVFFVISGFLITSLLLRAPPRSARGLFDFWRRRARRLLPALAVVVTVCATAAFLAGGDVLVHLRRQVLGSVTFSYNWLAITAGSDYFSATSPELFRNVWSLAVEEQFYLLWPLLLPLVLLLRGRLLRSALILVATLASAGWMAHLARGGEVTRAYFGTDSHAFGLLIGIGLAFLLWESPRVPKSVAAAGHLGILAIVVAAVLPETNDISTFPGTLLLASAGTALVIAASLRPGSRLGAALDIAPLRWIGNRSYGIYLWHWPILVLSSVVLGSPGPQADVPAVAGIITLVLTIIAAALSYRFIEQPIRRLGFRRALGSLGHRLTGSPSTRFAGLATISVTLLALGGTIAAITSSPTQSSAAILIQAGQQALQDAEKRDAPHALAAQTPLPAADILGRAEAQAQEEKRRQEEEEARSRKPVPGDDITAIGDSVMLASAPALYETFPGITVDAAVSRSIWTGAGMVTSLAETGQLRKYVVIALGTNGPIDSAVLEEIRAAIGPDRHLILVTAFAPRDWIPGVNAEISDFVTAHRDVGIADWASAIGPHPEYLAGDGIHPAEDGGRVFATTVNAAVQHAAVEERKSTPTPTPTPKPRH